MQLAMIGQKPLPSAIFDAKLWREGWRIYLRMMALLRPHWFISVWSVVCIILATAFAVVVPSLLQWVVDVGVHSGRFTDLLLASAAILGVSILRGLAAYGQGYYAQAVSNEVAYDNGASLEFISWSPDSRHFLYQINGATKKGVYMGGLNTQPKLIVWDPDVIQDISWLGGNRLVFLFQDGDQWQLLIHNLRDDAQTRVDTLPDTDPVFVTLP